MRGSSRGHKGWTNVSYFDCPRIERTYDLTLEFTKTGRESLCDRVIFKKDYLVWDQSDE